MAETGKEILDRMKEFLNKELDSLTVRRDKGREAIEHELDEDRKRQLIDFWDGLDDAYKRLLLAHSIITKDTQKSDDKLNCAVCLGLITEEEQKEFLTSKAGQYQ